MLYVHFRPRKFSYLYVFCRIEVDMKSTVYCEAVENGNEEEWNFGWERYQKSNVATEKRDLLGALSCTKEIWLMNRYEKKSATFYCAKKLIFF